MASHATAAAPPGCGPPGSSVAGFGGARDAASPVISRPVDLRPTPRDGPRHAARRLSRRAELAVVALPAALVVAAMVAVARNGAYASPDSAFYVGVARSLRDAFELVAPPGSQPLAHFPPVFPAVLAAAAAVLGVDPLDAAGVLNPVLAGATALVVGVVVRRRTGSVASGAVAATVVALGRESLVYGASALSEPLFTLLAVGGLVALAASITGRSGPLLAAATATVALACLTRYAGVALVVAGAAAILRFEGAAGRRRALAFAAGGAAPLALWLAAVGRPNRRVSLHLFDAGYWTNGVDAVSKWVAPAFLPWPVRVVVAAAAAVGLWRAARPRLRLVAARRPPADALPFVAGAFAAAYLVLLVGDRLLLDDSGRLDGRFLLPLRPLAVLVLAPVVHRAVTGRARRTVVVVAGAGLLALHTVQALAWTVTGMGDDSLGRRNLTARAWTQSEVLATVAALPPSVPVYTDGPDAVFLLTGRRTESLPRHHDLLTGEARPGYERELATMADRLRRDGGVVVWFSPFAFRSGFLPTPADVEREVPLTPVQRDEVGVLYRPSS